MSTTSPRPVRVFIAMEDGPLPRSIKQVLPMFGNESMLSYVENHDEADLVVFRDVRDIERGFSKEKSYAFMRLPFAEMRSLPDNCIIIDPMGTLVGLIDAIASVHKNLLPLTVAPVMPTETAAPLLPNALRILVIDDTPAHIASAKEGLKGHRLITVTGYEDAMVILDGEKFDVVLTDLHLPMSSRMMGANFKLGELVPYGLLLMVEAARQGAKHVAVVTDLSHHADAFSAAFDHFGQFPVRIDGAKVLMMHAPMTDGGAKDWAAALERLMKK